MENYKNLRLHMQYKKYRKWNNNEIQTEIWNKDVACKYYNLDNSGSDRGYATVVYFMAYLVSEH